MFYLSIAVTTLALSYIINRICAAVAGRLKIFDLPDNKLKTHAIPTPRIGGVGIFLSIAVVLVATRFFTDYPTGTIRNFRYILSGASIIFLMGLIDDLKPGGLTYREKFAIQFIAAAILLLAPVRMQFIHPHYLAAALSIIWVIGITNSINLIDIADGLAGTQTALASAAFLAIAFPSEDIYVNILAAAVLGATIGFLPLNFSKQHKLFMGDSGSTSLGYLLAVLAMGCSYSAQNPLAVYAPLMILGMPVIETFFLIYIRLRKGLNPFYGSRDHLVHRLQELHLTQHNILTLLALSTLLLCLLAFLISRLSNILVIIAIYTVLTIAAIIIHNKLPVNKLR
ncbi:MAG: MraY family glycosyltransferase [Elusimicrobiota bacterium]